MGDPLERQVAEVQAQVRELTRRVDQIPRQVSAATATARAIRVGKGNTLYTLGGSNWFGISAQTVGLASVPTLIPVVGGSYGTGLGYGYIQDPNGFSGGLPVWVLNGSMYSSTGTLITSTLASSIPEDLVIGSAKSFTATCAAGGTATVFVATRLL